MKTIFRKLGFHMTLTTQQPKGRHVLGLGPRSRSLGSCFAEKVVRRFVLPICWDFFAVWGGGGGGVAMELPLCQFITGVRKSIHFVLAM